jgi:hypothetical protein
MALFKIEDHEPLPSDEFYMIEEFKELFTLAYNKGYEGDSQGRASKRGHAEARFLFFICDHRSEYAKFSVLERMTEALSAAGLPEDHTISDELRKAIGVYEKLRDSRNLRLLKSAWTAVDALQIYFSKADAAQPDFDPSKIMANLANLGKVVKGLEQLEENVRAQEGQEAGSKGGAEKGRLD